MEITFSRNSEWSLSNERVIGDELVLNIDEINTDFVLQPDKVGGRNDTIV